MGDRGAPRAAPDAPVEVMLVGIEGPGIVLVGQPGEVFEVDWARAMGFSADLQDRIRALVLAAVAGPAQA